MIDLFIRGDAGVMAELRNVVRKKTAVEVLPVVDLSGKSAVQIFFVGDATQVALQQLFDRWQRKDAELSRDLSVVAVASCCSLLCCLLQGGINLIQST